MASVRYVAGRTYMEGNLNIAYKKFSVNLGYNYNAFNIGVGYDFKRFRLNYNVGKMFAPNSNGLYHEGGIQFKLSKSRQPQKTAFNHRLF
ncbi:MAG: hypothetical protein R3279_11175, partial [Putridiphycobacter sp.]|nr:hypothetical protein [Putridiphycobacter sp.]